MASIKITENNINVTFPTTKLLSKFFWYTESYGYWGKIPESKCEEKHDKVPTEKTEKCFPKYQSSGIY